ncbi:MAG TPA: hypothetical protein VH575_18960 [Gemmataceae bacterium]|jgi:hypothetical protein
MSEKPRLDHDVYRENRSKFMPADLLPYAEEWVAWNLDASRIVAHHRDALELWRMLDEAGIDSESVNLEWIPPGGEVDCLL